MYMKTYLKKAAIVLTVLSIALTGCKKDDLLFDSETSEDENNVAMIEDDNTLASDFLATDNVGGRTESGNFLGAGTVTYNPATKTATIDFGATNVVCNDGRTRRGKIIIKMEEGRPNNLPYTSVTSHENYFVNDNKVEGTRRERKTRVSTTDIQTVITVTDRKVTFTDGTFFTRNVNHTRLASITLAGIDYTTTGTANGITRRNRAYTSTIVSPVISKTSCNNRLFPVKGTLNLQVAEIVNPFVVDFGDGACDRTFTVSYNGRTKTITR
jgi:hypothetical protein